MRNTLLLVLLLLFLCPLIHSFYLPGLCFELTHPDPKDYRGNTERIQNALGSYDCVNISSRNDDDDTLVDWPVTGISVPSRTRLVIGPNARLSSVINVTKIAVVHINNATDVVIEGGGTIYGNAEHGWSTFSSYDNRFQPVAQDGSMSRPNCLLVQNSKNVVLRDLRVHNSTDWTVRMEASSNIWAERLDIYGDSRFPNNDGFDPVSCVNVTLVDSAIDVADDGVCPKATSGMGPLSGLTVRNVTIRSKSHAIKFGSNTDTDMYDIIFDNITIWDSNAGMSIQQRSQGNIFNITWSNVHVETRYQSPRWWGNGEWLSITNSPRDNGYAIGKVYNLTFVNITGRSENGGLLSGISGGIHHVLFENVDVTVTSGIGNYSSGPLPCFQNPIICSNDTKHVCAERTELPGTEISCLGSRDYRPTPPGNCSYYCRSESKANVLFMENVHDVTFRNARFGFGSPRRTYFAEACLRWDDISTDIVGADAVRCDNGGRFRK